MSDEVYDGHLLAEKLAKLNSSQQSIESLSRLCISHRKKAKQIVETWDKAFKSAQREKCVSLLYLANDILQNSRRKGSEFVNEFWKVLPAALRNVYENDDEAGKKAATRLIDIWDERRVFGSRGRNLKEIVLGEHPPAQLVTNGKSSNPIKIVKKDAHSLRIKLSVGGIPEKIITAFQLVHDENAKEEAALNSCEDAVRRSGDIERDVESPSTEGSLQGSALQDAIEEHENVLQHCVSLLERAEGARVTLVSHLEEALHEQELKLELIRTRLHVARGQIQLVETLKQKLSAPSLPTIPVAASTSPVDITISSLSSTAQPSTLAPLMQNAVPYATAKVAEEENKRAAAAAVAAKLAASTSSAQMLTSVLSSLVAEEAASMNSIFKSAPFPAALLPSGKKPKLENAMCASDSPSSELSALNIFASMQQQSGTSVTLLSSTNANLQPVTQTSRTKFPPPPLPPLPPPPAVVAGSSGGSQFVQSSGVMVGAMPYVYGVSTLPPPPPLPSHIAQGFARTTTPQPPQSQPPPQQQPMNGGYYRPPGIGFYGQSQQPAPPPVPR